MKTIMYFIIGLFAFPILSIVAILELIFTPFIELGEEICDRIK